MEYYHVYICMVWWFNTQATILSYVCLYKHESVGRKVLNIDFFFADFKGDKETLSELILTLTGLIVRSEFCQRVEEAGGITFVMDVFVSYPDSEVNWIMLHLQGKYDTNVFRWAGIAHWVKWLAMGWITSLILSVHQKCLFSVNRQTTSDLLYSGNRATEARNWLADYTISN